MPYSKRWYLVHLLGGKCVECGEENFGVLEIDHKHNDGDIERTYYTKSEKRYLDNPIRAKQRLQILCKECHEDKHYNQNRMVDAKPDKPNKMMIFMTILKSLEGDNHLPISENLLITSLVHQEFKREEAKLFIRKMLREASIYESKIGYYNRV